MVWISGSELDPPREEAIGAIAFLSGNELAHAVVITVVSGPGALVGDVLEAYWMLGTVQDLDGLDVAFWFLAPGEPISGDSGN